MQSTILLTQSDLTRQERLRIWLRRNGITQAALAHSLGVMPMSVNRWIRAERVPTHRYQQLLDFGVPVELLPRAEDVPTGQKPRSRAVS